MKGQYFSFDAVVGASIFILTLIAILSYWYGVSNSIEQQQSALAKEAIRIADIIYSPTDVPYGLTLSWNDKHLDKTKIEEEFCSPFSDPSVSLGSSYKVTVYFKSVEAAGDLDCQWGPDPSSNNIYKMRRVGSVSDEDGNTQRAYVDIYVYEPAPQG